MNDPLARRLEQVHERILRERMAGLPVLNPALGVRAVGMRPHEEDRLCVLITPWFMNLMLLPGPASDWPARPVGSVVMRRFPAGECRFLAGHEPGIGPYLSCSLFSPMFEFAHMDAAVETATAALAHLFDRPAADAPEPATRPMSRRDLLRGRIGAPR